MLFNSNTVRSFCLGVTRRTVALLLALSAPAIFGQTVNTVVNFNGTNGASPFMVTLAQGRDGNLYGTTYSGGANNLGAVVRINISTGNSIVLHSFAGTDGSYPGAGLTLGTDGNFYGTTVTGGSADEGVLYKITSGGTFTVLHQFLGGSDGNFPYAPPIEASDGNLYGTTSGANVIAPTIYKLTRSGAYSVVYTFAELTSGYNVYGLTQGTDGLLYATADTGGADGCGTIVKVTITGVLRATHAFNCTNGGNEPVAAPFEASDGNYYGTTLAGGTNEDGVLYKLSPAFGVSIGYDFGGEAVKPQGLLIQGTDGALYGTAQGALFSWSLAGTYSQLYTFTENPYLSGGLMQHTNGLFYGAAELAGTHSDGFVYSLNMGLGSFITFVDAQGAVGSAAEILGQGLTGTTSVTFNGIAATSFTVVNNTYLTAVVPSGATTGPVVVATPSGNRPGNRDFRVLP
jgi:uncharacterized repeat protein (TIGR03803 family)